MKSGYSNQQLAEKLKFLCINTATCEKDLQFIIENKKFCHSKQFLFFSAS